MKTKIIGFISILLVFIGLMSIISIQHSKISRLRNDLSNSIANEKALFYENDSLERNSRLLKLSIEQLNYINDSIILKINEERRKLKVRDRDVKQLQYLLSEAQKKDTITFRDTLFKNTTIELDTLLRDRWYQLNLGLRYPKDIIVEPKFLSEKYVIMSYKKETINPPKKCPIARLFQKKHKILEVEVVEKSPYIINKQQRFIEIINK